jgi:hypothetical protein
MARPVSHFFENIDAHLFYFFYSLGIPHFISIVTTVMLIFLSAAIWFCATNYAKASPAIATLMLALLWTNPNVFFAGNLFRDAKIAATFFFILGGVYSFRFILRNHPCRFRDFVIIFTLALLACLSDPQGFAFVTILSSIVLVWAFVTVSRPAYVSFFSGFCASLTYLVLSVFVLPKLVAKYTWFNTHSAFANYQHGVADNFIKYLWDGILLHLDTLRFLFGNVPRIVIAAGLVLLCIAIFKLTSHRLLIGFCFILLLLETFAMDGAMVARHSALMWPGVMRGGYYQLPSVVLFFTTILFILPSVCESFRIPKSALVALLTIAICANLVALPDHMKVRAGGPFAGYFISAPFLRAELVFISKTVPAGPALPYDARSASNSATKYYMLEPDKIDLQRSIEIYINTSRIYSFLRSEKGLPYNKP